MEKMHRARYTLEYKLEALQFHEVGTQMPHVIWIALPEGTQAPTL